LSREENKSNLGFMPKTRNPRHVQRWIRHVSAGHEDAWRERLAFLGTGLAVLARPGSKLVRLEAYAPDKILRQLCREFGGKLERIDTIKIAAKANAPRRPLRIARDLAVIDTHGTWPTAKPKPRILLRITGAMAFGTGEHATTSACLRFLRQEATKSREDWTLLDIGTGSGILAIAAEKLGAGKVEAFDYDERAIKAAQANIRRNRCHGIELSRKNLLRWKPRRRYPLVMANVFSEILRQAAPQISAAVRPGGCLILSGILRPQECETLATFQARGFHLEQAARRGKWVTLQLRAA
jgi:ribosomal protein L11 methyltransferase